LWQLELHDNISSVTKLMYHPGFIIDNLMTCFIIDKPMMWLVFKFLLDPVVAPWIFGLWIFTFCARCTNWKWGGSRMTMNFCNGIDVKDSSWKRWGMFFFQEKCCFIWIPLIIINVNRLWNPCSSMHKVWLPVWCHG